MTRPVQASGGKVFFIELTCSTETILQRMGNPSRAKFGKLTDAELYRAIERQGAFVFPPLPAAFVSVNTDELTPEAAAETIALALSSAKNDA
jgi:hypothetical protein